MSYLNREQSAIKRKIKVTLSGLIEKYAGSLIGLFDGWAQGVVFDGLGLLAVFTVDKYDYLETAINNPRWIVYQKVNGAVDYDNPLLTLTGFECTLNIEFWVRDRKELVDISFPRDNEGKYSWRGLKESGLPNTVYTTTYDIPMETSYVATVNGVGFDYVAIEAYTLRIGHDEIDLPYPQDGVKPETFTGGDCRGTVELANAFATDDDYTYHIQKAQQIGTESVVSQVWLKSNIWQTEISGTVAPYHFTTTPSITANITEYPSQYKYTVKDRHGLSVSLLNFTDINGTTWHGSESQTYYCGGIQTITADGEFTGGNDIREVSPAFDSSNYWEISDPLPSQLGGISCTNTEKVNPYKFVEEKEDGTEHIVAPDRVLLYAPLGNKGNDPNQTLSGDLDIIQTASYSLDDMAKGWQVTGGTWANKVLVAETGCSLKKTFQRDLYPAEEKNDPEEPEYYDDPDTPEDEHTPVNKLDGLLLPHLPFHTMLTLKGVNLDTESNPMLEIQAKTKTYTYLPVSKAANGYTYDLTRPAKVNGFRQDRTDTLYDAWEWEKRTTVEKNVWYIDETVQSGHFYGAITYKDITFKGFTRGVTYNLTGIETNKKQSDGIVCFTGFEFKKVVKCGEWKTDKGDSEMEIFRNRYLTIMQAGRFAETFCNQKSLTDKGIEVWDFPAISRLTNSLGGNKLLFPRDDANILTFRANAPVGGNPAPVSDLCTSAAYIGWLETTAPEGTTLKIRPTVDIINVKEGHNLLYEGELEFEGFIDLGGTYQGFTNAQTDMFLIDNSIVSNNSSQFLAGMISHIESLEYTSNQQRIFYEELDDVIPAFLYRYAVRWGEPSLHGYIWRDGNGNILRNNANIILRGDYDLEE